MRICHLFALCILLAMPLIGYSQEQTTALPIVHIDTHGAAIGRDTRTPATITITHASHADSIILPSHSIGIKVRGKTSAGFPKKSYSIEFIDSTQTEIDVQLMDMRSDDDWILDAMYIDHARMRNRLCTDIWNAYNRIPHHKQEPEAINGTRGTFVEVMLNGNYNGLYCLTERIDRKQLKLKKYQEEYRGVSFKAVTWDNLMGYCSYNPEAPTETLLWNGFESEYPGEASHAGWEYLQEFLEFQSTKYTSDEEFAKAIHQHVHWDNLIDYTLLVNAVYAPDNIAKNIYLSIYNVQLDHRMFFTPWDMDATFGRTYDGSYLGEYGFTGSVPFSNQLIGRLWEGNIDNFRQAIIKRWNELKHTTLSPDSVAARIYEYQALFQVTGAFAREQERWPALCAKDLAEETAFMNAWYTRNVEVIDSTLNNAETNIKWDLVPQLYIADNHLIIDDTDVTVTLYSARGNVLYNATSPTQHYITLPYTGIYLVRITDSTGTYTKKILHSGKRE